MFYHPMVLIFSWRHPFQPKYEDLEKLHKEKSEAYKQRILLPAIRSAARSVVGRYTPEQLYSSKRDDIQTEIFDETKKSLMISTFN